MADFFNNLFQSLWFFFNNLPWRSIFYFVRSIFLVIDAAVLGLFIFVLFRVYSSRPKIFLPRESKSILILDNALFKKRWEEILKRSVSEEPEKVYAAIIEADKLIEDVSKELGLKGEHLADRLEKLNPGEIKTLDRLWKAHRVRNDLVHTPEFAPPVAEAKKVLGDYEAFLKEIKIL